MRMHAPENLPTNGSDQSRSVVSSTEDHKSSPDNPEAASRTGDSSGALSRLEKAGALALMGLTLFVAGCSPSGEKSAKKDPTKSEAPEPDEQKASRVAYSLSQLGETYSRVSEDPTTGPDVYADLYSKVCMSLDEVGDLPLKLSAATRANLCRLVFIESDTGTSKELVTEEDQQRILTIMTSGATSESIRASIAETGIKTLQSPGFEVPSMEHPKEEEQDVATSIPKSLLERLQTQGAVNLMSFK